MYTPTLERRARDRPASHAHPRKPLIATAHLAQVHREVSSSAAPNVSGGRRLPWRRAVSSSLQGPRQEDISLCPVTAGHEPLRLREGRTAQQPGPEGPVWRG